MFQTEHGPSGFDGPGGGDEVNIVERGKNYGWPLIHHKQTQEGPRGAIAGIHTCVCAGKRDVLSRRKPFPQFQNNFFFGCLRGERIIRVVLDGRRVVSQENLLAGEVWTDPRSR